jgi:glutamine phosphoribosylpyrophosphate amidotransferase
MERFIMRLLLVTLVLETSKYRITISKEGNMVSSDTLRYYVETYWDEAHYPEDEDTEVIARDLKETLELTSCAVELRKE